MHSFHGTDCNFFRHSDMSGKVTILKKDGSAEIEVEGQDILDFVADFISEEKVSKIEQMSTKEILGI